MKYLDLNNGIKIPQLGLGTYKTIDKKEVFTSINSAIDNGYRMIDTASMYGNELNIGEAIKFSGLKRNELYISTKLWNSDQGYESTIRSFEKSLKNLQTDYIDLYLIHWPVKNKYLETWKAFEYLYKQGKVKAIGVSNFQIHHLQDILNNFEICPAVNQVELHPFFNQKELRDFCNSNGIIVQSWRPIMNGKVQDVELLKKLSSKYQKTSVQIVLRWHIQKNLVTIPKSVSPNRIRENINIFDFELTENEITEIDKLNTGIRQGPDPDNFNF